MSDVQNASTLAEAVALPQFAELRGMKRWKTIWHALSAPVFTESANPEAQPMVMAIPDNVSEFAGIMADIGAEAELSAILQSHYNDVIATNPTSDSSKVMMDFLSENTISSHSPTDSVIAAVVRSNGQRTPVLVVAMITTLVEGGLVSAAIRDAFFAAVTVPDPDWQATIWQTTPSVWENSITVDDVAAAG